VTQKWPLVRFSGLGRYPTPATLLDSPADSAESLDNVTPARGVGAALVVMIRAPASTRMTADSKHSHSRQR
jgi:hypothetical protein